LELEQALVQGEQHTELENLQRQWQDSERIKSKQMLIMSNYAKQQEEVISLCW